MQWYISPIFHILVLNTHPKMEARLRLESPELFINTLTYTLGVLDHLKSYSAIGI